MDDSRNCRTMLAADDQHITSVAIRHDLLLQIFRRVAASQVGLERASKPRALFSKAFANCRQLRAGVVNHLVRGANLAADIGDLMLKRGCRFGNGAEERKTAPGFADRGTGRVDRCEKRRHVDERLRLEHPALDR